MTFAHCFHWYLFYEKIVQIQLLAFVLIHTHVKVYVTSLVQKSQIFHNIFYINGQESRTLKQIIKMKAISQGTVLSKHCFTTYSTYMFAFVHGYFPTTQSNFSLLDQIYKSKLY